MTGRRNDEFLTAVTAAARALDGMRPVFEICEGLRQAMQPLADLQEQIAGIRTQFRKVHEQNLEVARAIQDSDRFVSAIARWFEPLATVAEQLISHARTAKALDEAGWLPHYSTPLNRVDACAGDSDAIHALMSDYYREHWQEVRRDIEARLIAYQLDDEAKAAFREALAAHEAGLYRSVCRHLMLEIERVARRELHNDSLERITSQHTLRDLAGRLPISSVEPGGFLGVNLFKRLSNHLYEHAEDKETRQCLARDPVPNRHATVHGLVVYSSIQNSLNTIFITDFIFHVISLLKEAGHVQENLLC